MKKNDQAFRVSISASGGTASVRVTELVIQSLGAQQGTATCVEDGKPLRVRLYRHEGEVRSGFGWVVATRPEVDALIAKHALAYAEKNRQGELRCIRSNYPNLHLQYRPKADADILALEVKVPSVEIWWK